MTKATDTAFPLVDDKNGWYEGGLTKREYFAATAMQGVLANAYHKVIKYDYLAEQAVAAADALINQLSKIQTDTEMLEALEFCYEKLRSTGTPMLEQIESLIKKAKGNEQ